MLRLDGVTQGKVAVDGVVRSASLALPRNHSSVLELAKNSLHRPLGDSDRLRDLADSNVRVASDAHEDVSGSDRRDYSRCNLLGWGAQAPPETEAEDATDAK